MAALAGALAAGLVAMAARFAPDEWERRAEVVGRAEELRARLEPLADADAAAYAAFLAERTPETTERTVAVPFEIAQLSAEVGRLARLVAAEGNPRVSGDASAAVDLAAAATSISARMVAINAPEDPRAAQAAAWASARDASQGLSL